MTTYRLDVIFCKTIKSGCLQTYTLRLSFRCTKQNEFCSDLNSRLKNRSKQKMHVWNKKMFYAKNFHGNINVEVPYFEYLVRIEKTSPSCRVREYLGSITILIGEERTGVGGITFLTKHWGQQIPAMIISSLQGPWLT